MLLWYNGTMKKPLRGSAISRSNPKLILHVLRPMDVKGWVSFLQVSFETPVKDKTCIVGTEIGLSLPSKDITKSPPFNMAQWTANSVCS